MRYDGHCSMKNNLYTYTKLQVHKYDVIHMVYDENPRRSRGEMMKSEKLAASYFSVVLSICN